MGRADTHLAACAIAAALILAAANCAVALADTPDSAGTQNNTSESNSDTASSGHAAESTTTDMNKAAESPQPNSVAAPESAPDEHTDEATQKKPVDKESCADNHHGKTINTVPTPEAPPVVELAPVPQDVAPALISPPPADLPPTVPSSPVDPDTVDATTGAATANHPRSHELPVLSVPFLPPPSISPHVLGASIAPRGSSGGGVVTSTPTWGGEPVPGLLRASTTDPLPEIPSSSGLTARGQIPKSETHGYASRSLAGMAATAMPGVAGLVIMTAGGICLGYRQAKAQLALIESAERFLY
jgi:hypothetical protein